MALNETFRALADPTRREILRLLNSGDLPAGDIAAEFEISAPSISHHLNILKGAGLVSAERRGQSIIYSLNSTVVQEFLQEMLEFFEVGEESTNHAQPLVRSNQHGHSRAHRGGDLL